ncbi:hypothetical protein KAX75_11770 [candidate division WOR-3 bacterium]|nr:hypothetical protein [candidate division WOR-3 bacterium]
MVILTNIVLASQTSAVITFEKRYGGISQDIGRSVIQTFDGGYLVVGSLSYNIYLMKTDSVGDSLWAKRYNNGGGSYYSVKETNDRNTGGQNTGGQTNR